MKISEILAEEDLVVVSDNNKETTLQDPKTKIKTIVQKDPNKEGYIKKDPTDPSGKKFVLDPKKEGPVNQNLKPGQTVSQLGPNANK